MSLNVTVTPSVTLPDLASVEAVAKEAQERLGPLVAEVEKQHASRLKELGVTKEQLVGLPPKVIDAQLRGKLNTARRYGAELERAKGLVESYKKVKAKIDAGQSASMFHVEERNWGRTRLRVRVKIVDADLLALHQAGLV